MLEDKYELDQNALRKTQKKLDTTSADLETTASRLSRTQGELTRVHTELEVTKLELSETATDLEALEEEQKSLRTLGSKMWNLSKSRASNKIRSVGDRLRGRGPGSNKKNKKNRR